MAISIQTFWPTQYFPKLRQINCDWIKPLSPYPEPQLLGSVGMAVDVNISGIQLKGS